MICRTVVGSQKGRGTLPGGGFGYLRSFDHGPWGLRGVLGPVEFRPATLVGQVGEGNFMPFVLFENLKIQGRGRC